jgi:hypothetical protein
VSHTSSRRGWNRTTAPSPPKNTLPALAHFGIGRAHRWLCLRDCFPTANRTAVTTWDNSFRIEGVRPLNEAEADACVTAYRLQQNLLRAEFGLPHPERLPPTYELRDTSETLAKIAEIHQQEPGTAAARSLTTGSFHYRCLLRRGPSSN